MSEPLILLRGKLRATDKKRIFCFNEFEKYSQKRRASQPCQPSLGSFFKRSDGIIPAELIDRAGLKGYRVNDAAVSEKHAGFAVNLGGATAQDVLSLLQQVSDKVFENTGIRLEPEIRLWNQC
jgi:UDP-N-acetylmuramate dehydrogenase